MTIMRLYNGNGRENEASKRDYRFSDIRKEFFGNENSGNYSITPPRANIREENDAYLIALAVPGLKKSEINIALEKDVLNISHTTENDEIAENYTRMEFNFRNFERSFSLPKTINSEKIKASYEDGILTVILPKRDEAIDRGPREIKIS